MQPLFDIPEVILHTFTAPLGRLHAFFSPCYFIAVFLWTCVDSYTAVQARVIWCRAEPSLENIVELLSKDNFIFTRLMQELH